VFEFFADIILVIIGFGSGIVVASAVFAFITAIGVVPRLAQKTRTPMYCRIYESAISLGGILGTIAGFAQVRLAGGAIVIAVISLFIGIFYGSLAMSLAEVLDVIPILTRRGKIKKGIFFFVIAIAAGKLAGSLMYFLAQGFYDPSSM
jgi:stage V sporulation protein AB